MNDSFKEDLSICNLGLSAQHKEYTACNIRINSAHNSAFIQRLNLQVIIKYCGRPFCNMKTNNMQFLFVKMMDCMATHHRGVYRMNCIVIYRTTKESRAALWYRHQDTKETTIINFGQLIFVFFVSFLFPICHQRVVKEIELNFLCFTSVFVCFSLAFIAWKCLVLFCFIFLSFSVSSSLWLL